MSKPILVCSTDPGFPSEDREDWKWQDKHGNRVKVEPAASNHFVLIDSKPVIYCEDFGRKLWRLDKIPQESMDNCVSLVKTLLKSPSSQSGGKPIEILEINNQPAAECKLSETFLRNGFVRAGQKLVL